MTSLSDRGVAPFVKLLYIGDSGTGKTGSLISLVQAGYELRFLDMDNGLDTLAALMRHQGLPLEKVKYQTFRDAMRVTKRGLEVKGTARAYTDALEALTKWDDDTVPAEWGPDVVLVLDSLTFFSRAAFNFARGMNPTAKDPRQWFYSAQQSVEQVLSMLTSSEFQTNVIVISHVELTEYQDGTFKGHASSIGKALGPKIPTYFNTMLLAQSRGSGDNVKRTIRTVPTTLVDLKNPIPFALEKDLPLATGIATVFSSLKG